MLQDYSHYATIISGITSIILLTVSSIVAIFVYKWNRENGRIETTRKLSEDLRHYNELVLHNEDLQELVSKSHRWGNLEKEGVIKMYRYFILFNIAFSMYEAKKRNSIDIDTYLSQINNFANTTYTDRDFINQHVLPRGYTNDFTKEFTNRWQKINLEGTLANA